MTRTKYRGLKRIGIGLILLAISVLGSGCSVPERTSVQLEPLHSPAAPVLLDVYSGSVDQDVYSNQGGDSLEPIAPPDAEDTLRDLNP